ncbi:very-long-chain aldehyde decarbonylase GL1-10-like [Phragmites australis]|uniref:very-long-chain aldehyde decarbonylase GL1-10-like n=1 Tax=Phragmites australis TaxID=29695 RepID=UPI002D78FC46|nr:very-long-chain aldehyde decarbonylase GL1-10-like [Phragmites australis]
MLPYTTVADAEAALGRAMTWSEAAWFRYSAATPDYCLYCHNVVILLVVYTLAPLPLALFELCAPAKLTAPYKLQPRVRLSPAAFLRCYRDTARVLLLTVGALQLVSYPVVKMVGIRTGLPLPSAGEMAAQLAAYFLVEDYLNYWIHRLLHTEWAYDKIHRVHHEYTAPIGFAAPYSHWAEVLILGVPAFAGPAIVPCHMTTFWLWFVIRHIEAIDTHGGFNFPFNPTKLIPFYGGAEYHDYHHYVGRQSQSNFASVFTFCDYIYGTDKGYRYHKANLAKMKDMAKYNDEKGGSDAFISGKQD